MIGALARTYKWPPDALLNFDAQDLIFWWEILEAQEAAIEKEHQKLKK